MLSRLDPAINFRDGVDFSGACLAVPLLTDLRVTIDRHQRADIEAADLRDRRSSLGLMMPPRTPSTPARDDRDLDGGKCLNANLACSVTWKRFAQGQRDSPDHFKV